MLTFSGNVKKEEKDNWKRDMREEGLGNLHVPRACTNVTTVKIFAWQEIKFKVKKTCWERIREYEVEGE